MSGGESWRGHGEMEGRRKGYRGHEHTVYTAERDWSYKNLMIHEQNGSESIYFR